MPPHYALWLLILAGLGGPAPAATPPAYEVYAVRYATIPAFPVDALVEGAEPRRTIDLAMTFWVLKRPDGGAILVDAGFYRLQFLKKRIADFIRPDAALARLGIGPERVTDIVVTHLHWDHVDGVDLFPGARVWVQAEEFAYYTGPAWQPGGNASGVDPDDVLALVKLNLAGRVRLVDGDGQEVVPRVTVYTGGRHTFASQYVGVNTRAGRVVIASDNLYLYENLERRSPIAQTFDAAANLAAQERMVRLAADRRLIVPGHDPGVFERFPKVGEGVARVD